MKRGGPLRRTTPLQSGAGLERKTQMPRGKGLRSGGSSMPRKAIKTRSRYTGPSDEVREILLQRSGGACEIGLLCLGAAAGVDPAHRMPKQMGGTRDPRSNLASNLLWACRADHDLIDRARVGESYAHGYKIRGRRQDPSQVPVLHWVHGWVYLNDDGTVVPSAVTATGEQAPR